MRAVVDQRGLTEWPCNGCGEVFPAEKYKSRGARAALGKAPRHVMCNRCLYVKYSRPSIESKKAEIHTLKMARGCADCGYNRFPEALQFDHRPGTKKCFNIGEEIGNYSMERLLEEIAKCDVVCANCHVERTVSRRVLV